MRGRVRLPLDFNPQTSIAVHPATGVEHSHAKVGTEGHAQAGSELLRRLAPVRQPRRHPRNRRPLRFPGPARPLRPPARLDPCPGMGKDHLACHYSFNLPSPPSEPKRKPSSPIRARVANRRTSFVRRSSSCSRTWLRSSPLPPARTAGDSLADPRVRINHLAGRDVSPHSSATRQISANTLAAIIPERTSTGFFHSPGVILTQTAGSTRPPVDRSLPNPCSDRPLRLWQQLCPPTPDARRENS